MKQYLMMGVVGMAACVLTTSCTGEKDLYDPVLAKQMIVDNYNEAFVETFGQPAANQDWGFGSAAASRMTRSMTSPVVADIVAPYDEAWVATYNETAKEPNSTNVEDNYDNTTYATNYGEGGPNYIDWNDPDQVKDRNYFFGDDGNTDTWEQRVAWALENHPSWITFNADETFVRNFKITDTYDGAITVVATEGLTDGVANNNERTVVVTGTWNITADQRVGSKGRIIIANGGTVNVASGVTLNMVNEARLVVLAGGKLTGAGKVEVNNGNAAGEENYNAGTVDVAVFNNNFGKFYNYGKFLVNEYHGGAAESNFYNHALAAIDHFGIYDSSTANARIFNACQFYVKNDARIRNYEGVGGSALIVGGQLMCSSSEDGTTTPTYVGLAAGALVQAGTLYNNGTSWTGPTDGGYAVLSIGKFDYMNWEQDAPQNGGYFANNLYLVADDLSNVPDGNGMQQKTDNGTEYYTMSKADYKFEHIVANATGNGNVTIAEKGDYEVIPADADFKLGEAGCTPGFKIKKDDTPVYPKVRIMAEDLSASEASDFDFNDIVMDVEYMSSTQVKITIHAAGGTLPLRINRDDANEVHALYGFSERTIINTYNADYYHGAPCKYGQGTREITLDVNDVKLDEGETLTSFSDNLDTFKGQVKLIKLEVKKNDGTQDRWFTLEAPLGAPACKICVPTTLNYAPEGNNVNDYINFDEWVQDSSVELQNNN